MDNATWTGYMKSARRLPKSKIEIMSGALLPFSVFQYGAQATVYAESIERALQMPGVTGPA